MRKKPIYIGQCAFGLLSTRVHSLSLSLSMLSKFVDVVADIVKRVWGLPCAYKKKRAAYKYTL